MWQVLLGHRPCDVVQERKLVHQSIQPVARLVAFVPCCEAAFVVLFLQSFVVVRLPQVIDEPSYGHRLRQSTAKLETRRRTGPRNLVHDLKRRQMIRLRLRDFLVPRKPGTTSRPKSQFTTCFLGSWFSRCSTTNTANACPTADTRLVPCLWTSLDISTSPSVTHNHPASQVLRGLSGCGAGRGDVEY